MNSIVSQSQSKQDLDLSTYMCFQSHAFHFQTRYKHGNVITWPAIDNIDFKKLVGPTVATAKGHRDQEH